MVRIRTSNKSKSVDILTFLLFTIPILFLLLKYWRNIILLLILLIEFAYWLLPFVTIFLVIKNHGRIEKLENEVFKLSTKLIREIQKNDLDKT